MTPEQKLQTLFAEDAAPARDRVFEAMVAERIARRRAIATVASSAPLAIAGGALLWVLHPVLSQAGEAVVLSSTATPVLMAAGLAVLCALTVVRQVLRT
ncbi:hypothetical protein [Brevundimonas sp.]|jgi:hypothetical protein|uniref:hypothetical protein n=1 Tax=Brevundimonas sp. TaxID=1871086 RepID=UPI0037BEB4BD